MIESESIDTFNGIEDEQSMTSQLANHSEVLTKKKDYVFPEEYFKAMTVGEWVKVIS
jgi:hypothetical protein